MNDNWQGNVSTIISLCWVFIAPYVANYFTQDQFTSLVVALIGVAILIWSAVNPNTLGIFGNKKTAETEKIETEEDLINGDYEIPADDHEEDAEDGC